MSIDFTKGVLRCARRCSSASGICTLYALPADTEEPFRSAFSTSVSLHALKTFARRQRAMASMSSVWPLSHPLSLRAAEAERIEEHDPCLHVLVDVDAVGTGASACCSIAVARASSHARREPSRISWATVLTRFATYSATWSHRELDDDLLGTIVAARANAEPGVAP